MTTEMGPRDVDLTLVERFAGHGVRFWAWVASLDEDDPNVRFDPTTATVRVTGESEYSGDAFARARAATTLTVMNVVISLSLVAAITMAPMPGGALLAPYAILSLTAMSVLGAIGYGSASLIDKINVIDHTTEPAPEELDELKAEFVDGEIGEEELGERAAEVWER